MIKALGYFFYVLLFVSATFPFSFSCTTARKDIEVSKPLDDQKTFDPTSQNSPETIKKPILILISIDGFRSDYIEKYTPKHITNLIKNGGVVKQLVPVYPSKTFPSHYSMITGLKPANSGLISGDFYDPDLDKTYTTSIRNSLYDPAFYFGVPLWNLAQKNSMRTASMFWIGSESPIDGKHPNYFYYYNQKMKYDDRTNSVIEWLKLPPKKRPHFITLYFEGVDSAGHQYGPQSEEVKKAVYEVDEKIGQLAEKTKVLGEQINFVIVSDHGMTELNKDKVIIIDEDKEVSDMLQKFHVLGRGPQILFYLKKGQNISLIDELQKKLSSKLKNCMVYKREDFPLKEYSKSKRAGDLILETEMPYMAGLKSNLPYTKGGNHGWDPQRYPEMNGILITHGSHFRSGIKISLASGLDIYPMIAKLLNLSGAAEADGNPNQLAPLLKD